MVYEAFSASVRAGVSASEFWALNPYQTGLIVEGWVANKKDDYKAKVAAAWYCEAFHRMKKLPDLDRVIMDRKPQGWGEQLQIVKQLMARGKNAGK